MRKLADLFFDKRQGSSEYDVKAYENMKPEEEQLVKELMLLARVQAQVNNACKDVNRIGKGEQEQKVAAFDVNIGNTSIETKIRLEIFLLKQEDVNDLKISIYSLVNAPLN